MGRVSYRALLTALLVLLIAAFGCTSSTDRQNPRSQEDAAAPMEAGGASCTALRQSPVACDAQMDRAPHADSGAADAGTPATPTPADDGGQPTVANCQHSDSGAATITLAYLVQQTASLVHLATLPQPPYESAFVSSHDPSSDTAEPGSDNWFANYDFIDIAEGETITLLDAQGPGVLTRFWSASPAGRLNIEVDDESVLGGEFADLFTGLLEPTLAPFGFIAAGGHNLYFPIPFQRSVRVTLTGEVPRTYYHISYRAYPTGTTVESFSHDVLDATMESIEDAANCLLSREDHATGRDRMEFQLSSGDPQSVAVIPASNGAMLTHVRLRPQSENADLLRTTMLSIAFDGTETVRIPLGDFFAVGLGTDDVDSLPITVESDGTLTSRWPMPFESEARISLHETGAGELRAELEVESESFPWTDNTLYFNAQWRAPETFPSSPPHDWTLATINGTGFYVGNVLNVLNRNASWWGEGDEKVYVDDEAFPSHFGTGTEDYYGYAWCSNERFTTAYVGQLNTAGLKNFGHMTLYRFHVLDPIPFSSSLRFDLEVRHWGEPVDVTYDGAAFWYALPGSAMDEEPAPTASFRLPSLDVEEPDVEHGPYRCGG